MFSLAKAASILGMACASPSPSQQGPHEVRLDAFEGPLDLLLFLIKKGEVDIRDIPIAEITDEYIAYLNLATEMDLDSTTEFYLMAATLLYIKSRMMLPMQVDLDEEIEDPREDLIEKLIEHQRIKALSSLMTDRTRKEEWVMERRRGQRILPFLVKDQLWKKLDVWELVKSFSRVVATLPPEKVVYLYEEVSIAEKINLVRELISQKEEFLLEDLLRNHSSIMEIVCSFFAILELTKTREITVYQNRFFGEIKVRALSSTPQRGDSDSQNTTNTRRR